MFRPVQKLIASGPEGRMLWSLAQAGVAVYSAHTAFDNAPGGNNDILARRLGLVDIVPLRKKEAAQCKVVVFVPESDLRPVSDALFQAGAGRIGEYTECSYRVTGTGTFFGSDVSNPTVGRKGQREEVTEWRLEVVCPAERLPEAIRAMRKAHSYEEPAFDVYPLQPAPSGGGEGRLGRLHKPLTLDALARRTRKALGGTAVQIVGDGSTKVERLAIACGAAGEFLRDAVAAKADAFLTGEMRFHDCLSAQAKGVGVILPGHYATERPGVEELAELLQRQWPDVKVWASQREADPLQTP
jgi:dinuclear metal center YbgI/SA1388 family protein